MCFSVSITNGYLNASTAARISFVGMEYYDIVAKMGNVAKAVIAMGNSINLSIGNVPHVGLIDILCRRVIKCTGSSHKS